MTKWQFLLGLSLAIVSPFAFAEPVTAFVAANSAMISLAGTAFSVFGALSQGQQASKAGEYNAAIARNNAIASQQQAAANAAAQQRKARLQMGSMRAAYGASGVSIEGSPLDVLEASAATAELDRQNILYGGALRTQGYESTAGLEMMRGSSSETGSYLSAGSSLLSGAVKAGAFDSASKQDDWYNDAEYSPQLRRVE